MLSDDDAERASDFLRDNAQKAGELRAERIHAEEFRKHLKALLMKHCNQEAVGAQEREAYADPRYLDHLEKMKEAVRADEVNRALREGAVMRITVYQTQSANTRGRL